MRQSLASAAEKPESFPALSPPIETKELPQKIGSFYIKTIQEWLNRIGIPSDNHSMGITVTGKDQKKIYVQLLDMPISTLRIFNQLGDITVNGHQPVQAFKKNARITISFVGELIHQLRKAGIDVSGIPATEIENLIQNLTSPPSPTTPA